MPEPAQDPAAVCAPSEVVHVAAQTVTAETVRRQRCAWCGALLEEYDLARLGVQVVEGEEPQEPSSWAVGGLVAVSGTNPRVMRAFEPEMRDGVPRYPENSCMAIDREVTK